MNIKAIAATRFVNLSDVDLLESLKRMSNGDPPQLHDGIYFYSCGSNASHNFSLGVKDGKLWKRSQCYDLWIDENGEEREVIEDKVYEVVDPSKVYLGSH